MESPEREKVVFSCPKKATGRSSFWDLEKHFLE